MRKPVSSWSRLAVAAVLAAASSGASFAANNIAVPNGGGGGQCGVGNPNVARFAGNCGAVVTIDDLTNTAAYVQENNPSAETSYRVRLYANFKFLTMAGGDEFDLFAAYDGADPVPPATNGDAALRIEIQRNGSDTQVVIAARLDNDTEATTAPVTLVPGWRSIELSWVRSTGPGNNNGSLSWWLDGVAQTGLSNLDNDTEVINYSRWGAVAGLENGTQGTIRIDDYASQRSAYIGPAVAFPTDAGTSQPFFSYIQGLYAVGVTTGCGPIGSYCPNVSVPRDQMAAFLVRATNQSPTFVLPPATGNVFADVPIGHPFAAFIEQLFAQGITTGCIPSNDPNTRFYCPGDNTPREQMAVFLLRAKHGGGYTPPPCGAPVFNDVPCSNPFSAWINQLFAEGITTGCGGGNYCPTDPVPRDQMAAFLDRTFNFPRHFIGP